MEPRIVELEVKLSFAEDQIEALNRTVWRQQQQIEDLQRALRDLHQRLEVAAEGEPHRPGDEIPPHY